MDGVTATIVALCGAGVLIVTAVGALAVQVLRNARDIQAAWQALHAHEQRLNGGNTDANHP